MTISTKYNRCAIDCKVLRVCLLFDSPSYKLYVDSLSLKYATYTDLKAFHAQDSNKLLNCYMSKPFSSQEVNRFLINSYTPLLTELVYLLANEKIRGE